MYIVHATQAALTDCILRGNVETIVIQDCHADGQIPFSLCLRWCISIEIARLPIIVSPMKDNGRD